MVYGCFLCPYLMKSAGFSKCQSFFLLLSFLVLKYRVFDLISGNGLQPEEDRQVLSDTESVLSWQKLEYFKNIFKHH